LNTWVLELGLTGGRVMGPIFISREIAPRNGGGGGECGPTPRPHLAAYSREIGSSPGSRRRRRGVSRENGSAAAFFGPLARNPAAEMGCRLMGHFLGPSARHFIQAPY
jgi:hypothetical protein